MQKQNFLAIFPHLDFSAVSVIKGQTGGKHQGEFERRVWNSVETANIEVVLGVFCKLCNKTPKPKGKNYVCNQFNNVSYIKKKTFSQGCVHKDFSITELRGQNKQNIGKDVAGQTI